MDKRRSIGGIAVDLARGMGAALIGVVHARLALASYELRLEKFRLIQTMVWTSAIVFMAMMTLTFSSLIVVYLFWESARLAVLIGFACFYGLSLLAMIIAFRRFLATQPKPFEGTLQELENDADKVKGK